MFEISFPVKNSEIETVLIKIISIGLCSTYYDAPYEVTVDSKGYGFYEKENEFVNLQKLKSFLVIKRFSAEKSFV